jgi:hypothetical protein
MEAKKPGTANSPATTMTTDPREAARAPSNDFDTGSVPAGLTCRVYQTEAGTLAGIPDVTDLTTASRK